MMDTKPTKKRPAPTRRRDKEETMKRLLEAALHVFSKFGYDAATTKLIAKKAEANEALINRYFDGKSGLLVALVTRFIKETDKQAVACPDSTTLEEEFRNFFKWKCQHIDRDEPIIRVVLSRAIVDKKVADALGKSVCDNSLPPILSRIEALRTSGRIRSDVDVAGIAMIVNSISFTTYFLHRLVMKVPQQLMDSTIEESIRMLCDHLRPR